MSSDRLRYFLLGTTACAGVAFLALCSRRRRRNKRVFVSGCFDLLHSGHVAFFKEAAALGFNPPVCTENWDHEIHYHGFYRQWLKMLEGN